MTKAILRSLKVEELKTIIRSYNLHTKIKMTKRTKADLVDDLDKHVYFDNGDIKLKSGNITSINKVDKTIKDKQDKKDKEKKDKEIKEEPKKKKMTIDDLLELDMNEPEFSKERLEFYKKNNDVIKKFLLKFVKHLPTTMRKNLLIGSYGQDFKKDTERIEFLKKKVEKNPRKVIEEIIMYEDYVGDIYDEIVEFFEKLM